MNKMRVFLLKDFISKSYDVLCFYITYIKYDKIDIALKLPLYMCVCVCVCVSSTFTSLFVWHHQVREDC